MKHAKRRPQVSKAAGAGAEAALALQEELVAAIHGAFEVAVQIAVREVRKLVGQSTADAYEEMRRENEALKQRLRRAEAMLDSARMAERGGGGAAPSTQLFSGPDPTGSPPRHTFNQTSHNPKAASARGGRGVSADSSPVRYSCAQQFADSRGKRVRRAEEQGSGGEKTQPVNDAASDPEEETCAQEITLEISRVCTVKVESLNQPCQGATAQDHRLAPPPITDDKSTLEQLTVKQEKPEEEEEDRDGSACCWDSIKVEGFSLECMLAEQAKTLGEWEPEVPDTPSQDPSVQLSSARLVQDHLPNMTSGLPPPTDLPSLSSEFPIVQMAEPALIPEGPPQIYGVHVRTSRSHGHAITNPYSCKSCGQTFHLASLLRRHYGQCPQKLQQRCQQPGAGSKRTRLQLYPPGCSPFRCTECNREFNRMENLKTHLRIHTGERPYTCSVCSKCFRHSGALTRHFRIHTGEKPYICGQCGKSFRNCGGLKFHQRSHSKQLQ